MLATLGAAFPGSNEGLCLQCFPPAHVDVSQLTRWLLPKHELSQMLLLVSELPTLAACRLSSAALCVSVLRWDVQQWETACFKEE